MRETDPNAAYDLAEAEDYRREREAHSERLAEAARSVYAMGGLQALRDELKHPRGLLFVQWTEALHAEIAKHT